MTTRREFLHAAGACTLAVLTTPLALGADKKGVFQLTKLPYAYDALEPAIDAETMTIHHTKHHQAYVDNLNKTGIPFQPLEQILTNIEKVPEVVRTQVRNHGGGVWNHDFFWNSMTKPGKTEPKGELLKALESSFRSMDGFRKEFSRAATSRFGSGWVWLVRGKEKLEILTTPKQDNPLMENGPKPLLALDVWEHAYYLKYRSARADYVQAWYTIIDWNKVAERLNEKS